jgi:hypothetical protein
MIIYFVSSIFHLNLSNFFSSFGTCFNVDIYYHLLLQIRDINIRSLIQLTYFLHYGSFGRY